LTTTAIAPTNIAVLKYWGRKPGREELSIPTKSSISFTVEGLCSTTTISASPKRGKTGRISLRLNDLERAPGTEEHAFVEGFFRTIQGFFPSIRGMDFKIASSNNFPTAAGFASSASGFAALAKALSGEVEEMEGLDERRLSVIARIGSGSAARSIPTEGGIVIWHKGGMWGSFAETIHPPEFWPGLRIIYATIEAGEKRVKSRVGMQASVQTNPLYQAWASYEETALKGRMLKALGSKDFPSACGLIMRASNNFHQICLGTFPPLIYLNEGSFRVMEAVGRANSDGAKAAYTFDAGPNAVVFTLQRHEKEVAGMLRELAGDVRITKMGGGACFSNKHIS
jgi:diphosphomevalonate decarboxylase